MSVGMPQSILLQQFGSYIKDAFGEIPYHVGSSLLNKDGWRDVDVRLLLPDKVYYDMELGDPEYPHENKRWVALTLAWSAFGKTLTGLPIDFQIQPVSWANAKFPSGGRSAIFRHTDIVRTKASNS